MLSRCCSRLFFFRSFQKSNILTFLTYKQEKLKEYLTNRNPNGIIWERIRPSGGYSMSVKPDSTILYGTRLSRPSSIPSRIQPALTPAAQSTEHGRCHTCATLRLAVIYSRCTSADLTSMGYCWDGRPHIRNDFLRRLVHTSVITDALQPPAGNVTISAASKKANR